MSSLISALAFVTAALVLALAIVDGLRCEIGTLKQEDVDDHLRFAVRTVFAASWLVLTWLAGQ